MTFVAATRGGAAATVAASDAPTRVATTNGHVALPHQPQSTTGNSADPQVQSTPHGRFHQTKTGMNKNHLCKDGYYSN